MQALVLKRKRTKEIFYTRVASLAEMEQTSSGRAYVVLWCGEDSTANPRAVTMAEQCSHSSTY